MNNSKRTLLKSSSALGLLALTLPEKWAKPVVNSVLLPVHAMMSEMPPSAECSLGFVVEPVSEPITITVTGNELSGPIAATLDGNSFNSTQTLELGLCSNNVDVLSETVEFSGTLDSAQNSIVGDVVIRQFCAGVLACEQITSYTVVQSTILTNDDGEYQGTLVGTLNCCQDFL